MRREIQELIATARKKEPTKALPTIPPPLLEQLLRELRQKHGGRPRGSSKYTVAELIRMAKLQRAGVSFSAIGREFGVTKQAIHKILKKAEIPRMYLYTDAIASDKGRVTIAQRR